MKKSILTAAVMLALGAGAAVAGPVSIDRNGTSTAGGDIVATSIQWNQGNLLFINANDAPGGATTLVGHHTLSSFNPGGQGATAGTEWTLVYSIPLTVLTTTLPGGTTAYTLATAGGGTFAMYYDCLATCGGGGVVANAVTGLGYGDGRAIVNATALSSALVGVPIASPPAAPQDLDAGVNATNDAPGVTSWTISGSVTLGFEILDFDTEFFPGGLDVASPLTVDIVFGPTGTGAPIINTEPSDIVGFAPANAGGGADPVAVPALPGGVPNYGEAGPAVNDPNCVTISPCDLHTGGSGATSFGGAFVVPEPGSLALLGLGLGALGMVGKRRRSKVVS